MDFVGRFTHNINENKSNLTESSNTKCFKSYIGLAAVADVVIMRFVYKADFRSFDELFYAWRSRVDFKLCYCCVVQAVRLAYDWLQITALTLKSKSSS